VSVIRETDSEESHLDCKSEANSKGPGSVFRKHLTQLVGTAVYFHRLPGNHGDKLIEKGAEFLLKQCRVSTVENPDEADTILINGGGSFNVFWSGALDAAIAYREKYPNANILVGPQSYSFNDAMRQKLAGLIDGNPEKLTLFAREQASFDILVGEVAKISKAVPVELSQDLAFELADTEIVTQRRSQRSPEHVLVSFRSDIESPFLNLRRVANLQRKLEWNHGSRIGIVAAKCLRRVLEISNRSLGYKIAKRYTFESLDKCPIVSVDASVKGTFEEFLRSVENSCLVITDRLHVAIYAHLLGIPQFVVVGNQFHKVASVCRMSMSGPNSNTRMVDVRGNSIQ
jgi:exopolysaccharide biosynthesis predicted pyruvyltransferase EpsI